MIDLPPLQSITRSTDTVEELASYISFKANGERVNLSIADAVRESWEAK